MRIATSTSSSSTRRTLPTTSCSDHRLNRGPDAATLHVLPTLWFRNTWSWRHGSYKPDIRRDESHHTARRRSAPTTSGLADYHLYCDAQPRLLFTENETNIERLFGAPNADAVRQRSSTSASLQATGRAVNPAARGNQGGGALRLDLRPQDRRRFVCG